MSAPERPDTAQSARITRHVVRARMAATVAVGLAIGLAGCSAPQPVSDPGPGGEEDAQLVLIGVPSFSFEDFALGLADMGYEVPDAAAVSSETDLLLVVVNAQDGVMPQTREAVEALAGSVVPRVAIALIDVDKQTDAEIETLIVLETVDLLARYGIAPVDSENILRSPGSDIASVIGVHLRRAPRDYRPVIPAEPSAPTGPVRVDNFAGVPMTAAMEILAAEGLVAEVLADPALGLVNDCDPLVMGQEPSPGTMLAPGGAVGLVVSAPDRLDPAMAGCLLPELTPAEIDARLTELAAQPSG